MRLYFAGSTDRHTLLNFDKWANEAVIPDVAPVEIAGLYYADIRTEGYIFNMGCCDRGFHCSTAAL